VCFSPPAEGNKDVQQFQEDCTGKADNAEAPKKKLLLSKLLLTTIMPATTQITAS
jgi:hypothetical protein